MWRACWWCCWPGLLPLWRRGSWWGLAIAVAFGAALNVAIVTSFVWRELVTESERGLGWLVVAAVWLVCAGCTFWQARRGVSTEIGPRPGEDLFPHAVNEYLRKNWLEAERLLQQLIDRRAADVEAQLLLAALWRRTGRRDEARRQLARLGQSVAGATWQWEIDRELALLDVESPDAESAQPAEGVQQELGEEQGPEGVSEAA